MIMIIESIMPGSQTSDCIQVNLCLSERKSRSRSKLCPSKTHVLELEDMLWSIFLFLLSITLLESNA